MRQTSHLWCKRKVTGMKDTKISFGLTGTITFLTLTLVMQWAFIFGATFFAYQETLWT
ncbi:hypothetical protein WFC_00048 [Escherichia phage vB_EcoM_WFC]|uniref:Uncharacterized protein n=2 Tax=Wifcevirus TaxID=2733141 RepID=A0A482MWH3_9CAUD|nr:hypothetical protein HOV52_gp048 [Escherichia phage vB_EcoM_WFC]QBQ77440.1 hypothetical protein WFC_00048 [Escherichia phage vB_EcoM_WFC]